MNRISMNVGVLALCGALLPGCALVMGSDEVGIEACEILTKEDLKSPSSYQRVKAVVEPYKPGKPRRTIWLTYDSANGYGTMIRDTARCDLRPSEDGEFHELDSVVTAAKTEQDARILGIEL